MNSYSCTECGRCTSECPANQTGKLLSPRKIMMDTRQRLKEVGKNIDKYGKDYDDKKSLVFQKLKFPNFFFPNIFIPWQRALWQYKYHLDFFNFR